MNQKFAKMIRIATLPPIMALVMILLLWDQYPPGHAAAALLFLCVLPVLAYPLCSLIPSLKRRGRAQQRKLAIQLSIAGYGLGTIFCLFSHGSSTELLSYLSYVISAVLIAVFTRFLKIKGSGHACGTAGPVMLLALRLNAWYLLGFLLMIPIYISSITLKRHTLAELIWGTLFSTLAALILSCLIL